MALETGLLYADKGEKTNKSSLIFPGTDLTVYYRFIYRYRYIDIPLKLNYYIRTERFRTFIAGGISTNIFLNHTSTSILEFEDGRIHTHAGIFIKV
jgi:hypothetical protein